MPLSLQADAKHVSPDDNMLLQQKRLRAKSDETKKMTMSLLMTTAFLLISENLS